MDWLASQPNFGEAKNENKILKEIVNVMAAIN